MMFVGAAPLTENMLATRPLAHAGVVRIKRRTVVGSDFLAVLIDTTPDGDAEASGATAATATTGMLHTLALSTVLRSIPSTIAECIRRFLTGARFGAFTPMSMQILKKGRRCER